MQSIGSQLPIYKKHLLALALTGDSWVPSGWCS